MRLAGITLETFYFEAYLSFLSEVLELELIDLTDTSMRFSFMGTWLKIEKVLSPVAVSLDKIDFELDHEEFDDLLKKLSFFKYRRDISTFALKSTDDLSLQLNDPDGRVWCFEKKFFVSKVFLPDDFCHP